MSAPELLPPFFDPTLRVIGLPLQDARTMLLGTFDATADDLEAHWRDWAVRSGFRLNPDKAGSPGRDLTFRSEQLWAYVNENRWVAQCGNCGGGIAVWPDHPRGCCLDCGHVWLILFPLPADVDDAKTTLELRPEKMRNWQPWEETPHDLRFENISNGFPIPAAGDGQAEPAPQPVSEAPLP